MNSRALRNLRRGRIQRALAAATAFSALPLGAEIYFEHFRGSFGDKWMWTPIALSPLLSVAGIAGVRSERAARTLLPVASALYCLDGLIGVYTHVQGVRKRSGVTPEWWSGTRISQSRPRVFVVLREVVEDLIPRSLRPDEHVGRRLERGLVDQ